jgi:predicted nucleic acid-binding protein
MKRTKIYLDTSVIGGVFDVEFQVASKMLFEEIRAGKKIAVISDITISELGKAPTEVQGILRTLPESRFESVTLTDEAVSLAELYLKNKIVTPKYREDALHIALATLSRVDVLVSWNFKHIVNLKRIQGFNAINLKEGYPLLEIRSPLEVLDA